MDHWPIVSMIFFVIGVVLTFMTLVFTVVLRRKMDFDSKRHCLIPFIWCLVILQFFTLAILGLQLFRDSSETLWALRVCGWVMGIAVSCVMIMPNFVIFGLHIFLAVRLRIADYHITLGFVLLISALASLGDGFMSQIYPTKYQPYLRILICEQEFVAQQWEHLREFVEYLFHCAVPLIGCPLIGVYIKPPFDGLKGELKVVVLAMIFTWMPDQIMRFMDNWLWDEGTLASFLVFQFRWQLVWQSILYPSSLLLLIRKLWTLPDTAPSLLASTSQQSGSKTEADNDFVRIR